VGQAFLPVLFSGGIITMRKPLTLTALFAITAFFIIAARGRNPPPGSRCSTARSRRLEARRPRQHDRRDGLIRTHGGMGLLYWTGGKLSNCRLRVVFKMRDHNDIPASFIRIPSSARRVDALHYGYEVQIDNEPEKSNEETTTQPAPLSLTKPLAKPGKPGPEWNTMVITLDGPHHHRVS